MKIAKLKLFKYFILVFFFLFLFGAYNANFQGPDDGYFQYTASVVEDGDLNLINQFYRDGKYISKTYNLPDPHYYGGVILWVPFYAYAKIIYSLSSKFNFTIDEVNRLTRCAMSFSTIVFGFLVIFFTYRFLRIFFSNIIAVCSLLAILFGTPFFYYMLYKPGNGNIISCLFSILLIWFSSCMINMKKAHWFLYGAFFSICVTVKMDLWFPMLFIFPLFSYLCVLKKINWKNGIYFLFGFGAIVGLRLINAYLKYDTLRLEELRYLIPTNLKTHYFFNGLFSPYRGILYTSPILYICLTGFIIIAINNLKNLKIKNVKKMMLNDFFSLILTFYAIIKIFVIGFDFPEEDFSSARFLITEFSIFAFLYARVLHGRRIIIKYLIVIISVLFVFWNLLLTSETMTGLDWVYISGAPPLGIRINVFKQTLSKLFFLKDLNLKLKFCLPLVLFFLAAILYMEKKFAKRILPSFWYKEEKNGLRTGFSLFAIYSFIGIIVVTLLNVYNNKRNVEKLKADGFFENAVVIAPSDYEQGDFYIARLELMQYYALKGRFDMYNKIRLYKDKYFRKKDTFGMYSNEAFIAYDVPGVFCREKKSYDKAIGCFNTSILLDPNDTDAYMNLGEIYSALNEEDKAIDCFQKVNRINPGFIHSYLWLGKIYSKRGNDDEAIKLFQRVTQINPSRAEAYLCLGNIYYKKGIYNKAIFNLEEAIHADFTSTYLYRELARLCEINGDYDKAIKYLRKSLQYDAGNTEIYYNLGNVYSRTKNIRSALEQASVLRKLKRIDLAESLVRIIEKNKK